MSKTTNILEEGQEIIIDSGASSINQNSHAVYNSQNHQKTDGQPPSQDLSTELAELNELFSELESMIEEKKQDQVASQKEKETREINKETEIVETLDHIQENSGHSIEDLLVLPEDEEQFNQDLAQFNYLPSRTRLIKRLKTCIPAEGINEFTTINEYGNYYKIKLAMALDPVINEGGIAPSPTMYIASGLDIEFPLLLQSRHIIMVDPCFNSTESVNQVISKINQYDSYDPEIKQISPFHYNIKFRYNFGRDLEIVNLDLFGKKYQDYNNFLPLGTIIEYNSSLNHTLAKADLIAKLMTNGLIINNQPSPMRDMHVGWLNRLSNTLDPIQIEDQNADHLGLNTIRIPFIPFAVYQKRENNSRLLKYSESIIY